LLCSDARPWSDVTPLRAAGPLLPDETTVECGPVERQYGPL
jgi:hypothetical protein